jgi:hypothetical protein
MSFIKPGSIKVPIDFGFPLFEPVLPKQIREVTALKVKAD